MSSYVEMTDMAAEIAEATEESDPMLSIRSSLGHYDIEAGPMPCCRICLESDADELIAPCMCKGTQQFVHRYCLDHWRSVKEGFAFSHCTTCQTQFHFQVAKVEDNLCRKMKFRVFVARDVLLIFLVVQAVIAAIGGIAYVMDNNGTFGNLFGDIWDRLISKRTLPFYYSVGVVGFLVLIGTVGLLMYFCANSNDPRVAGFQNCCYGWGLLDCFPASMEACFALVVTLIVIFALLGLAFGCAAASMIIQRIWQRHYHILTKRELTKEYVVMDLGGNYTTPTLDPEHELRLRTLKLI